MSDAPQKADIIMLFGGLTLSPAQSVSSVYLAIPGDETHPNSLQLKELHDIVERCCQEYERLIVYAEKGDIKRHHVPENLNKAYKEIKTFFEGKAEGHSYYNTNRFFYQS